jgi:hypothetical protein
VAAATIHAFSLLNAASDSPNRENFRFSDQLALISCDAAFTLVCSYAAFTPVCSYAAFALACSYVAFTLVCSYAVLRLSFPYSVFRTADVFTLGGTDSELLLVSGHQGGGRGPSPPPEELPPVGVLGWGVWPRMRRAAKHGEAVPEQAQPHPARQLNLLPVKGQASNLAWGQGVKCKEKMIIEGQQFL